MTDGLHVRRGGDGPAPLLLLHGLGADADVWDPLLPHLEDRWRWAAVDLPGHGGSAPLPRYSFGALAAAVAPVVDPEEPSVVLGHSLGGVVALTLASGWFGLPVAGAVALGSKVVWTGEELAGARALARRPVQVFGSRQEAVARALKVAGLTGLVGESSAERLVVEADDGWRLTLDPAAFGVGAPRIDAGSSEVCRKAWTMPSGTYRWSEGRPTDQRRPSYSSTSPLSTTNDSAKVRCQCGPGPPERGRDPDPSGTGR